MLQLSSFFYFFWPQNASPDLLVVLREVSGGDFIQGLEGTGVGSAEKKFAVPQIAKFVFFWGGGGRRTQCRLELNGGSV